MFYPLQDRTPGHPLTLIPKEATLGEHGWLLISWPAGDKLSPRLGQPGCWSVTGPRGTGSTLLWDGWDPSSPPPPPTPPAQEPLVRIRAGKALPGKQKCRLCEDNVTHQAWAASTPVWSNQPNDFIAPETNCEPQEDWRRDLFCLKRAVKKAALTY